MLKATDVILQALLMELVMYLDDVLIDSIPLEMEQISKPGYISGHIRNLRERYALQIEQTSKEPQFLLHASATKIFITEESIVQGKLF